MQWYFNFDILHGYGVDNFGSAVNFLWEKNKIEKKGAYVVWEDKSIYKSELINKAANDLKTAKQLKDLLQRSWYELIKESAIKRPPKYGIVE